MIEVKSAGKFARMLVSSTGQQVLIVAEQDESGTLIAVGRAAFYVDDVLMLVSSAFPEVNLEQALTLSGKESVRRAYADSVLHDIKADLIRHLALKDDVGCDGVLYRHTPMEELSDEDKLREAQTHETDSPVDNA
jgi:hypothetical protein